MTPQDVSDLDATDKHGFVSAKIRTESSLLL